MPSEITNFLLSVRKVYLLSALFFCGLFFLPSCKKTGDLTPEFSDGDLNALHTDTISISTTMIFDDSLRTDETSRSLFGIYNDPVFGTTIAAFYTQVQLSTQSLNFPTGASADSIVLKIKYDGTYANADQQLKMLIYEITQNFVTDDEFYNYSSLSYNQNILATREFFPGVSDSLPEDSVQFEPHLSVKLDKSLAQRIINNNNGQYAGNDNFLDVFKGFYITPDTSTIPATGDGGLVAFNLLSAASRAVIYYHYPDEDNQSTSGAYEFVISTSTPRFNYYKHDYADSEAGNAVGVANTTKCYAQPMAGMKTRITFPHIRKFSNENNIAVNKAELYITVTEGSDPDWLAPPQRLLLITKNEEGTDVFISDYFEGTDFYGGIYDANTSTYRFNIARYFDELINEDKEDRGLFLIVSGSAVTANRLVFNSGVAPENRLKLRLTFTQL